ncbi:MAG TPA: CinA family nicotinamide mononucleotide deamidase-related protein [Candidatus Hydrogenedentes bacterium]|nr:CinA family nicotinamide mononucleotide deamidase-related protein [Candidatus Hydrogenedentota bacterium]
MIQKGLHRMQAEILMIGTELLLGQINDTNATYMGQTLADNGINLFQKTTVGDNRERIVDALNLALDRSDVVLCSGGLGPTEDDLTRECVAQVVDAPLEYHEEIFDLITAMFARYNIQLTENNKKQALVPKGGTVIDNPNGTAPGLMVECDRGMIFCMPGVPRELKPMLEDSIIPTLRDRFELDSLIHYRVLHICGIGESRIDDIIGDLMTDLENPKVGVLASPAKVRVRISAKANSKSEANALIDPVDAEIRSRFPNLIMGTDDDTVEGVVNELLLDRGWTLAVVETTSGGSIGQLMTAFGAQSYVGGRIYPLESLDLTDRAKLSMDLAEKCMVELASECTLSVVSDIVAGMTIATLFHPHGREEWTVGRSGRSKEMQDRIAILTLEHVRRFLVETQ